MADGLAAGKGVTVARTVEEACAAADAIMQERIFGDAGAKLVVEECLVGEEASFLAFCDGKTFLPMASSQDHKPIFDGDKGPNTGGMGAYSPAPVVTDALFDEVNEKVMKRMVEGMAAEGNPYVGIDNTAAEWNFYLDPHAAAKVLASGVPIRLMPLDATQVLPVTPEFVDRVRTRPRDQTSDLLLSLLEAVRDSIDVGIYYFWDVLAAVATAHPEVLACREESIDVVTQDGLLLGRTRVNVAGAPVCVVEEINRQAFEEDLLEAILD